MQKKTDKNDLDGVDINVPRSVYLRLQELVKSGRFSSVDEAANELLGTAIAAEAAAKNPQPQKQPPINEAIALIQSSESAVRDIDSTIALYQKLLGEAIQAREALQSKVADLKAEARLYQRLSEQTDQEQKLAQSSLIASLTALIQSLEDSRQAEARLYQRLSEQTDQEQKLAQSSLIASLTALVQSLEDSRQPAAGISQPTVDDNVPDWQKLINEA